MTKDKKYLITINTLMMVFFIFFEIFFGIYVYNISQDINLVFCYNIFKIFVSILITILLYNVTNRKKLIILYRLSFIFAFLSILTALLISNKTLFMIFIAQFFLATTQALYHLPYEVAIMNKNSMKQMYRFVSIVSALSLFISTLGPFLSGLIIDMSSYIVLFILLIILVILCFIFSNYVDFKGKEFNKIGLLTYFKKVNSKKGCKFVFLSYSFFKMANDLVASMLLPILIYFNTGTNFSVGIYSSVASLIAGLVVILLKSYFAKKKLLIMWISTIFQVSVSILILSFSSIYVFFIYFFTIKITKALLQNGVNSSMFNLPKYIGMKNNLIEHFCAYNLTNFCSVMFILITSFIFYTSLNNTLAIVIILAVLSILQIVSTLFVGLGDKYLNKEYKKRLKAFKK